MSLIKCKECGHEVSDKASACPNCGCPIGNVGIIQEEIIDPEPKKRKGWIWALIVVLLCLIGGGGYYAYTHLVNKHNAENENVDSSNSKEDIVELTPEFAKSLEVYDELAPFSEGYAAVRRGKKWGYINTKGEEVIPCSFDAADIFSEGLAAVSKSDKLAYINTKGEEVFSSPYSYYNIKNRNFSEGLAAVCDDGKWGWINQKGELVIPLSIKAEDVGLFSEGLVYCQNSGKDFSFVDKNGTVVFTGKTNYQYGKIGHTATGYYSKDFPKFRDGFAYVNDDFNTVNKYTKYDKQGKKCGTISENELPEYRLIREDESGLFEENTVHMGLKGKDGTVLIKPYYSLIGTDDANAIVQVSNGVVLVMLVELSEYNNDVIYHYGYADLKGHDTFSKEIKEKVNKSREVFYQKLQEEESLQEDDSDWLQGRWVGEDANSGYPIEVIISGDNLIQKINGQERYNGPYEFNGDMLIYNNANDFWPVDGENKVLTFNGIPMRKEDGSSSSYSSSPSSSDSSNSNNSSYRFSSPQDVIGWLADKSFYNGNRRLRIRAEGVWLNDYCATGAPNVERWESWKALIRAYTATGERLSFFVDPINGTVTDEASDVFRLR